MKNKFQFIGLLFSIITSAVLFSCSNDESATKTTSKNTMKSAAAPPPITHKLIIINDSSTPMWIGDIWTRGVNNELIECKSTMPSGNIVPANGGVFVYQDYATPLNTITPLIKK